MKELRDLVGSVHHLAVFAVAAHHESFTDAAHELAVTQPAVSRSVRGLEAALGVSLFRRGHRSVTLTEEGKLLYHSVSAGFDRMFETAQQLHRRTRQSHVTVITSSAFANYWMLPRLSDFHRRHDIELRVQISDRYPDLSGEPATLAAWWGDGSWAGCNSVLLAREEVFPVASPAFVKAWKGKSDPESLAGERLIHLEEPFISALTWREWFAEMDVAHEYDDGNGLWVNDYTAAMHAAMAGEGIALGWRHVVDGLLEKGLLVRLGDRAARRERQGCYLVWSSSVSLSPQALAVKAWFIETASAA